MRWVDAVAESITAESALSERAEPIGWTVSREAETALAEAVKAAAALNGMQRGLRTATLNAVSPGELTATEAFVRVEATRRLNDLARLAARAATHLLGRGD